MNSTRRGGFTLVELLVVVGILVLLTTMIVWGVSNTRATDRARGAARTIQSAFLGARDRAVHAKERRGIRFLRGPANDPTAPNFIITGFEYTMPLPPRSYGGKPNIIAPLDQTPPSTNILYGDLIQLERIGNTAPVTVVRFGEATGLYRLAHSGVFGINSRIRIPAATGRWYTVKSVIAAPFPPPQSPSQSTLLVQINDYGAYDTNWGPPNQIAVPWTSTNATCDIELATERIPFGEPVNLPSGMVIDLRWSQFSGMSPSQLADPTVTLEMMFAPSGAVTGPIGAFGPIFLMVSDLQDAVLGLSPIDRRNRGEKLILAVFPQTGNVQTFPIDPTDLIDNATHATGADGLADDLFRFARIGAVTAN